MTTTWMRPILPAVAVAIALVTACGNPGDAALSPTVEVTLQLDPAPARAGPVHLAVTLADRDGAPLSDGNVTFTAQAAGAEPRPLVARAKPEADGVYGAPFIWTAPGPWRLTVAVTLPDRATVTRSFDIVVAAKPACEPEGSGEAPSAGVRGGAVIRIASPGEGAVFAAGEDVRLAVETENFALGECGNHWHVYVDGRSSQMVMGKAREIMLSGLAPGRHTLSASLAGGSHQELGEVAAVAITVAESDR